jgi:ankyrin repeat protein
VETGIETTTHRPKRRRTRKALWLGLFVVLQLIVGGRWLWRQVQFSRLRSPLIEAVKAGNTERVRNLLEQGADANVGVDYKPEPLTWVSVIRMLRGNKTTPIANNPRTTVRTTVLMAAVMQRNPEIVHALLEHDAQTEPRDKNHDTALNLAAYTGNVECMRALLKHGATINPNKPEENPPLYCALAYDQFEATENADAARFLLEQGANPDAFDHSNMTLLMRFAGWSQGVQLLLTYKADVNKCAFRGWTPLIVAIQCIEPESVRLLLNAGATVDQQDEDGHTALWWALDTWPQAYHVDDEKAQTPWRQTISLLLDRGADVTLKDKAGKTPMQKAQIVRDPVALALLRKAAARTSGAGKGTGR